MSVSMITPQQFLDSFWDERVAAHAETNKRLEVVHAKYFGEPLLQHARDFLMRARVRVVFEDVKQSAESAIVITKESLVGDAFEHKRYHLSADGESWKITRIDRECLYCNGTGQAGTIVCQICDGVGWCDPRKNPQS